MSALPLVALLLLVPAVVTASFHLNALILILLFGTVAQAWNIIGGYAGQLSFGHTVFFGLGAYTSSVLLGHYGIVPWVGAPAGALAAVALSLAIGYPTFRLRRHFFALATLALAEIARITFLNWRFVGAGTGFSLPLRYRNALAYLMWDAKVPYYYTALALFLAAMVVVWAIERGRAGIYLKAISQDEGAAQALGVDAFRYKQWAMGLSAALTALAGSLYAQYVLYIDPYTVLTPRISLLVVVMALIGGRGTVWGPVLGAAFIVLLSEYSRTALGHLGQGYDFIVFGVLIILLSVYEPTGLLGLARRVRPRPLRPVRPVEGGADPPSHHPLRPPGQPPAQPPAQLPAQRPARLIEEPVLTVEALTKRFAGITALDDVRLVVRRGEILGLIGPNGAGKSTLFDAVTGFQRPEGGHVRLDGRPVTGLPAHRVVHRGLVRTFQLIRIFPELTVLQNALVGQPHAGESVWATLAVSSPAVSAQAERLLRLVGLQAYRDVGAAELSYGQQKLLTLAMALMTGAEVVLLDEPTAGVNPVLIQELIAHIRELNRQGQTFVVIEHNMEVITALAHRVYFMADGRILAEGTPEEIQHDPQVLEAYYGR